jgi:hypothetical protein
MIEDFKQLLERVGIDGVRLTAIVGIVVVLGLIDSVFAFSGPFSFLTAALTSTSIVLIIAAVSHLTRRILFPNIDLKKLVHEATYNPLASALVFLGVCIVLSVMIIANVLLLV